MGLRTVLYGYRKEYLNYYIVPEEANVVRQMFSDYLSGETLQDIAEKLTERQVVYFEGKTSWTKHAVRRILENPHYVGDMEYPAIISKKDQDAVMARKSEKGGSREQDTEEVAWLKRKIQCGQCGHRFTRRRHYSGTHEKGVCSYGCKTAASIDDAVLYDKLLRVLNKVIEQPVLLKTDEAEDGGYEPSLEVLRADREIDRMIEQKNPSFIPVKKAIFEYAAKKFDGCLLDYSKSVTPKLQEYIGGLPPMETLDFEILKKLVNSITIHRDGNLSVQFLNQATVNEQEETDHDDRIFAEGCNENCRESGTCGEREYESIVACGGLLPRQHGR